MVLQPGSHCTYPVDLDDYIKPPRSLELLFAPVNYYIEVVDKPEAGPHSMVAIVELLACPLNRVTVIFFCEEDAPSKDYQLTDDVWKKVVSDIERAASDGTPRNDSEIDLEETTLQPLEPNSLARMAAAVIDEEWGPHYENEDPEMAKEWWSDLEDHEVVPYVNNWLEEHPDSPLRDWLTKLAARHGH